MDEREQTAELEPETETQTEVAIAAPVAHAPASEPGVDEEEIGSGGNGRIITAIGAVVLLVGMFLTWYQVVRSNGFTENTTGWQTFTKLRFLLLLGSVGALVSVLMRQTRAIVLGRLAVGLVASALVIRRIVSPPDLPGATVTAQLGIYIALLGGLGVAFGGLLGIGTDHEDEEELADERLDPRAEPAGQLPPVAEEHVVDAEIVDDTARA